MHETEKDNHITTIISSPSKLFENIRTLFPFSACIIMLHTTLSKRFPWNKNLNRRRKRDIYIKQNDLFNRLWNKFSYSLTLNFHLYFVSTRSMPLWNRLRYFGSCEKDDEFKYFCERWNQPDFFYYVMQSGCVEVQKATYSILWGGEKWVFYGWVMSPGLKITKSLTKIVQCTMNTKRCAIAWSRIYTSRRHRQLIAWQTNLSTWREWQKGRAISNSLKSE